MKFRIIVLLVVVLAGLFVSGCKKSTDDEGNAEVTYKDPPSRPSVSIYDAVEWGNGEQVHAHFYYKTATLDGEKGNYPLIFVAVAKGQPHIVKQLLSYGENPNRICDESRIYLEHLRKYSAGKRSEVSVLNFALQHGKQDIAKMLADTIRRKYPGAANSGGSDKRSNVVSSRRYEKGKYIDVAQGAMLIYMEELVDVLNARTDSENKTTVLGVDIVGVRQDGKKEPVNVWVVAKISFVKSRRPNVKRAECFAALWEVEYSDKYEELRCSPVASLEFGPDGDVLESLPAPGKENRNGIDW